MDFTISATGYLKLPKMGMNTFSNFGSIFWDFSIVANGDFMIFKVVPKKTSLDGFPASGRVSEI